MIVRKKHLLTILLLGVLGINIPVLAAVGEWSVNGSNMYYLDGFVGIGKDVVSTPLHVRRSSVIDVAQKIELESTLTGANWEALRIDANANTSNANSISWEFDSINAATGPAVSAYRTSATETDLSFSATDNDLRYELMRLQGASGNVGIGVTDPKSKLSVNGNIQITNANRPMGIMTEIVGTDPLLNLEMNFRSPNKTNTFKGASFRIDSRNTDFLYQWWARSANSSTERLLMNLSEDGRLNIGTSNGDPNYKLQVNGTIRANEIVVSSGWADYVFADDYKLRPLNEVESFIEENKHLPGIPSATEIQAQGLSVGDMQKLQMEKIEELTLYNIELKKQIDELKKEVEILLSK